MPGKPKRYAAGRARALGIPTRGTTNPNRLRRNDNWITAGLGEVLTGPDPLVVDLGYGATAVTTLELAARLWKRYPQVRVLGLEIDQERVERAKPFAEPPRLDFARGGFELAGRRPTVVRAMNVLRQYEEQPALDAWGQIVDRLAPGGVLVEGTCDEIGRIGSWILVNAEGPQTLTLACSTPHLDRPGTIAERLPKALIHHNVPGERIHEFFTALDAAWDANAGLSVFSARQRWAASVAQLTAAGWPVLDTPRRHRLGEVTVPWSAIAP